MVTVEDTLGTDLVGQGGRSGETHVPESALARTTGEASEHGPIAEIRWGTDASGLSVGEVHAEWAYDEAGRLTSFADHLERPRWEQRRTYVWDDHDVIRAWTYEDRDQRWEGTQDGDCPPTDREALVPWLWPQLQPVPLPTPMGEGAL